MKRRFHTIPAVLVATLLREYTRRFDAEARRIGARTVLYMVWPSLQRFSNFDGVSRSHAAAAQEVGGILIPRVKPGGRPGGGTPPSRFTGATTFIQPRSARTSRRSRPASRSPDAHRPDYLQF